jgi:branched-subunit amino acid aminotransferase/4-amino-4-deoxychorismate lyase
MGANASASSKEGILSWHWDEGEIRSFQGGLPLSDRGFRYGQHLFESVAIRYGVALLAAEHLALLASTAKVHGYPFPRSLVAALRSFLNSMTLGDGMLRIFLTAGSGAPASVIREPGCYLTWEPSTFPTLREIEKGYAVTLLKKPYLGDEWGIKCGNYAAHLNSLFAARSSGADEGIVHDAKGRILSCAMGNLIVWMSSPKSGKELLPFTPSTNLGVRRGAVLRWVSRQTRLIECELRTSDLRRARALAVTNSRLGIMPVATLDGRSFSDLSSVRVLTQHYLYSHGLLGSS